jgi:hypothetical protein
VSSGRTNVHLSATFDSFGSLKDMKRTAMALIGVLAVLLMTATASAARGTHSALARCAPSSHILYADSEAAVYTVRERLVIPFVGGGHEVQMAIATRGCAYGQKGSYKLGQEYVPEGTEVNGYTRDYTLVGSTVAYEEFVTTANRYTRAGEVVRTSLRVIVRDLRTGRVLHEVPTGTPPKPEPGSVGVGKIVALVLKSDGSVAWIAKDSERSATAKAAYFDVYATDRSGMRLLASGTSVDPASLALSVGATHLDSYPHRIAGSTLSWTQGGQSFSTTLN